MSKLQFFLLVVAIVQLVFVLEFVRRRKLLESFALLWMTVGVGGVALVVLLTSIVYSKRGGATLQGGPEKGEDTAERIPEPIIT